MPRGQTFLFAYSFGRNVSVRNFCLFSDALVLFKEKGFPFTNTVGTLILKESQQYRWNIGPNYRIKITTKVENFQLNWEVPAKSAWLIESDPTQFSDFHHDNFMVT